MKLYYAPGACSLSPHIVMREAGQSFTLIKVDTAKHVTAAGQDYFYINPKGMVPLLELDDGTRLSEGPVITQYIADQAHSSSLIPRVGSIERYRVMEWQNYITSEIHKSFTPLFNAELDASAKTTLSAGLRRKLEWVDGELFGKDYLTGTNFTVADAYLFTVLGWAKYVNLEIADLSNIQRFLSAVAQRPAVQEAMKAEGLLAGNA